MENKKRLVFLTGAGISKESGIPTFRDSIDGLWENYPVEEVATHKAIVEHPEVVYKFINTLRDKYKGCKPNYAHEAIAELENKYNVTVITQNIDNLHEQAGSRNVIHLHGNLNKVRAIDNENLIYDYPKGGDITPETKINGNKVRPHIVLFGENVPNIERSIPFLKEADICVVIGTSFNVYPAASLIDYVVFGNPIYYIDPNPAKLGDMYNDVRVIKATATEGMKQLIKEL